MRLISKRTTQTVYTVELTEEERADIINALFEMARSLPKPDSTAIQTATRYGDLYRAMKGI